jgi:hypothetical protein
LTRVYLCLTWIERLNALSELKILGRVAEDADLIYTIKVLYCRVEAYERESRYCALMGLMAILMFLHGEKRNDVWQMPCS